MIARWQLRCSRLGSKCLTSPCKTCWWAKLMWIISEVSSSLEASAMLVRLNLWIYYQKCLRLQKTDPERTHVQNPGPFLDSLVLLFMHLSTKFSPRHLEPCTQYFPHFSIIFIGRLFRLLSHIQYPLIPLCIIFSDVLGSAKGWAASLLFHPKLRAQFQAFVERSDTFSLGVCNGCQLMSLLGWLDLNGTYFYF